VSAVRSLGARLALATIAALTPVVGAARAQAVVARGFALLYLARFYLGAQYAKASLGSLWVALAPLFLAAVYLPIFLFVFQSKLPGDPSTVHYALYGLAGLVIWAAVQDAIAQGAGALVNHPSVVRHAPTPPALLPVVKVMGAFAGLAFGLAVFVLALAIAGQSSGARLVLVPVAFLLLFLLVLGLALGLAAVAAYVRDVIQILPTALAIEFFAAPIVYASVEGLPRPLALVIELNPLTPSLALLRAGLFAWQPFAWWDLGLGCGWAVVALVLGAVAFKRLEGGLADVI
jgi:ABC-type polysaccharide/polyol phosphate export permease